MTTVIATLAALVALLPPAGRNVQSETAPEIRILSPADGVYVSGIVRLQAIVQPMALVRSVRSVTFQVDGILVCTIERPPYECDWDAGPTVEEHQIRAVANLREGGRLVATVRTKKLDHAESVDVTAVQVTVTVTNSKGRFVSGLPRTAFRVFEDDRAQTIQSFASLNVPLELVAAIDISGSMRTAIPQLKGAVKEFLAAVPPRDNVTLIGFNDNIFPLTRRSKDPTARMRAVDRLAAWGGTALYDVIVRGMEMLDQMTGRKALVVFTDGEDQGSHLTSDAVLRRLEQTDATLYMIGQGPRAEAPDLRALMERLSRQSGGRAFFPDRIDELSGVFAEIIEDLSNQYLLSYSPTNTRLDGTWRAIRIELTDPTLRIRAREGYRARTGRQP
jgi:Ca-activated chloride channel family protein